MTDHNSLRYPIPVPLLHHHTSTIITDCNRSTTLFPWLDLPGFLPGTETKREVWLLRTGFGIAPVNKLISLTWLLWALRSFRSFTLHYITFVGPDIASDHRLMMAGIRIKLRKIPREALNRRFDMERLTDDATRECFRTLLDKRWKQPKEREKETAEDTCMGEIRVAYTEVAQQVLGYKGAKKQKLWITREVLELSDKRTDVRKVKDHNEENRKGYKEITREIRKKAKRCKAKWIEGKCQEIEDTNGIVHTRKLFQVAREICGTVNTRLASVKNKEGKPLDNKREIKERWKQRYEELYNEGNPVDDTVLEELPASNGHEQMLDIMEKEVEVAIQNLKRRKAPGEDNITAAMIQAEENCSVEMLHTLCNQIYYSKDCPRDWGKAIIVPLHTKGDRAVCSNYRAISLLSVPGEVYTKVLQQRLKRDMWRSR